MSNRKRIIIPGSTCHTMSRCIDKKQLLNKDEYKEICITSISMAHDFYDFDLIFFTIMDNHVHFVIKTHENGPSISRIMQYIKARIAEMYNKKANRSGPFWNERFKDIIIDIQQNPFQYFMWLLWYLAFNPVRVGKCKDPRSYAYSSINNYLKREINSILKIKRHKYFEDLGHTFSEKVRRFLFYEDLYRKRIFPF